MWNPAYWKATVYLLAKQPSLIKLELTGLILSSGWFLGLSFFKQTAMAYRKKNTRKIFYHLPKISFDSLVEDKRGWYVFSGYPLSISVCWF